MLIGGLDDKRETRTIQEIDLVPNAHYKKVETLLLDACKLLDCHKSQCEILLTFSFVFSSSHSDRPLPLDWTLDSNKITIDLNRRIEIECYCVYSTISVTKI